MWRHQLSAVLIVALSAIVLRVSFVPAMNNLISTHSAPETISLKP
ncbi:MAG TPA: hypothetical protein V6D29_22350 [Leptolyngbyaceae cyanobacterium]